MNVINKSNHNRVTKLVKRAKRSIIHHTQIAKLKLREEQIEMNQNNQEAKRKKLINTQQKLKIN